MRKKRQAVAGTQGDCRADQQQDAGTPGNWKKGKGFAHIYRF